MILLYALFLSGAVFAKGTDSIPADTVLVSLEVPPGKSAGPLSRALAYLDSPVLLWNGEWKDPGQPNPVPGVVAPVRLVLPGIHRLYDLDSDDSVTGEIAPESFVPNAKIFRVLLPITGKSQTRHYEASFQGRPSIPLEVTAVFRPTTSIVVRNPECRRRNVALKVADKSAAKEATALAYLYCVTDGEEVRVAVYAPFGQRWTHFGHEARPIWGGRGLLVAFPRGARGGVPPENAVRLFAETDSGQALFYDLVFVPAFRPRRIEAELMLGAGYHYYSETFGDLSLNMAALQGKLSLVTRLYPDQLGLAFDVQGALADFWHASPAGVSGANPYSMSVRAGYYSSDLPTSPRWSASLGWYMFFLHPGSGDYGLASELQGPHLFLERRIKPWHRAEWRAFLEYAMLSDQVGNAERFQNYLMGLGGSIEIAWIGSRRPLSAAIEITRTQFSRDASTSRLYSLILGLRYPLY